MINRSIIHGLVKLVESDSCLTLECALSVSETGVEFFFDICLLGLGNIKSFAVASTDLGFSQLKTNLGCYKVVVTTDVGLAHRSHVL